MQNFIERIANKALKLVIRIGTSMFTQVFIDSLKEEQNLLVLIEKPDKSIGKPISDRPICLPNILGKVPERIIIIGYI